MTKKNSIQKHGGRTRQKQLVRETVVGAAATGIATFAATQALGATALATGVVASLAALFQAAPALSSSLAKEWQAGRQRAWFEGWLRDDTSTVEQARDEFVRQLETPGVRDAIFDHLRRIEEAIDEAALPLLGALAREYARANRRPDAFFRNATRFLAELDAPMIADASKLIEATLAAAGAAPRVLLRVGTKGKLSNAMAPGASVFTFTKYFGADDDGEPVKLGELATAYALFDAMRRHGIGQAGYGGYMDLVSGPHVVVVEPETLKRLRPILTSGA